MFDVNTLSQIGSMPAGAFSAFALDNTAGVLLAIGLDGTQETLYAINADLSSTLDTIALPANQSVRTRGFYDKGTGLVYTAHTALAEVGVFNPF